MGFEGPYQDLLLQALQLLSLVATMERFEPLPIGNFQPVTFYLALGDCVSGYVLQWPTLRGHSQLEYKKYYCFNQIWDMNTGGWPSTAQWDPLYVDLSIAQARKAVLNSSLPDTAC